MKTKIRRKRDGTEKGKELHQPDSGRERIQEIALELVEILRPYDAVESYLAVTLLKKSLEETWNWKAFDVDVDGVEHQA